MENIKISVKHNDWSEVFDMLVELGAKHKTVKSMYDDVTGWLFVHEGVIWVGVFPHERKECREVTFQELKDMVVLKRNCVDDATHVNLVTGSKVLQQGDKNYYWQLGEWHLYPCGVDIKPIEKKEMKEFLVNHDNKWTLQLLDSDTEENSFRVAVPSGATHCAKGKYSGNCVFLKVDSAGEHEYYNDSWLFRKNPLNKMYFTTQSLWQRSQQPEELPFIDDEPKSLNDTYAEIEQVRQHNHYFKDVSDIDQMDVYEVLKRFEVTDPCLQHIVKKALCAGQRGHKDFKKDLQDILDTAVRAVDINK